MAYADELQAVSVDEALIDVTSQVQALSSAPPEFEVSATDYEASSGNAQPALKNGAARDSGDDWAKVLAEKIRSDVRKATGCEGWCRSAT